MSESVADALARRGITEPFPIQDRRPSATPWPAATSSRSRPRAPARPWPSPSRSSSGPTGKTRNPEALVLAPTRELAAQVASEIQAIAGARSMRVATVVGGVGIVGQGRPRARSDVVVATPGRLEDLVARRLVRLDDVSMLVLDEVDRMLDVGFRPAVERIVALLRARAPDACSSPPRSTAPSASSRRSYTRNPCAPRRPAARPRRRPSSTAS